MQQLWSPLPWFSKVFNWLADHLPEAWMFSTAVYVVWHPVFEERMQNAICVAGLMSVATALVRLKKIEGKIDEMRGTQLLREGRWQEKESRRKEEESKRRAAKQEASPTPVPARNADDVRVRSTDDDGGGLCADISARESVQRSNS